MLKNYLIILLYFFFSSYDVISSFKRLLFFRVFYEVLYRLGLFLAFFNIEQFFDRCLILL